jgi:pilus assembly protein CpaE
MPQQNTSFSSSNKQAIEILAVLGATAGAVHATLQDEKYFTLDLYDAAQCTRLPWQAERQPDLVLLEPPTGDQDRLAVWLRELGTLSPKTPVLVLGELLSVGTVQALLALRSTNVVSLPLNQKVFLSQISTVMRIEHTPAAPNNAKCWSFMSAVGGAGATTLAIETALQLQSACAQGEKIALIDLNFMDGACAAYLDVPANLRLGDVADAPERIDEALIDAFASPHAGGFDVLAAARDPFGYQAINAQSVGQLLDVCCHIYDHVVIDMSRWMQDWTMDVIGGSDALVLVSELTVPALHAARDLAMNIGSAVPHHGDHLHIVLNRMAKRVFGHSISMADAQKALGRPAIGSISSDWDGAAQAVNYGLPIGQASAKSRISKDIQALISALNENACEDGALDNTRLAS